MQFCVNLGSISICDLGEDLWRKKIKKKILNLSRRIRQLFPFLFVSFTKFLIQTVLMICINSYTMLGPWVCGDKETESEQKKEISFSKLFPFFSLYETRPKSKMPTHFLVLYWDQGSRKRFMERK